MNVSVSWNTLTVCMHRRCSGCYDREENTQSVSTGSTLIASRILNAFTSSQDVCIRRRDVNCYNDSGADANCKLRVCIHRRYADCYAYVGYRQLEIRPAYAGGALIVYLYGSRYVCLFTGDTKIIVEFSYNLHTTSLHLHSQVVCELPTA